MTRYRDLPLKHKITFLLMVILALCIAAEGLHTYRAIAKDVESVLGDRIEHIARTAALLIDPEKHEKLVEAYLHQEPRIVQTPAFKEIQQVLAQVQKANELSSDLITLIRPEWKPETMLFMAMSNPKTYVGNSLPLNPFALKTIETGAACHSDLYEDRDGHWVAAFAPIKNRQGNVIAVVQVTYQADRELTSAKLALIGHIAVPAIVALFLSFALGSVSGGTLARPIGVLAQAAQSVSKGDLEVQIKSEAKDEVGQLALAFNNMVAEVKKNRNQLEDYSRNLEKKVEERTLELKSANQTIGAMLNSLSQGFLVFDREGKCSPIYSAACEDLFETKPAGKFIWDVIDVPVEMMKEQIEFLFNEPIPFSDAARLCPRFFRPTKARRITLSYYPIRNELNKVTEVVCVGTDRTKEIEATDAANRERAFVATVLNVLKYRAQFLDFIREARSLIAEMKSEMTRVDGKAPNTELLFRLAHTIKGGASVFSMVTVTTPAHELEGELTKLRGAPSQVAKALLPRLLDGARRMENALESFVSENRVILGRELESGERTLEIPMSALVDYSERLAKSGVAAKLKSEFTELFLREPIQPYFQHYEMIVRRLADENGKAVAPVEFHGGETRVETKPLMKVFTSLVHAFRNAVDHGIETSEERTLAGKPAEGKIRVSFAATEAIEGSPAWLTIVIQDDGRGIDPVAIRAKLREEGRREIAERESDFEVIQHVFDHGFSTRALVDEISGRGVGMSAIADVVKGVGGLVEIQSTLGQGTSLTIMVPLEVPGEHQLATAA